MIALVTYEDEDERTGEVITLVSHGVDIDTLENVVLPPEPPSRIGRRDPDLGWVLA
jgi:hypothetical protein